MSSESNIILAKVTLPIFALPAGVVLFPRTTVRLPLDSTQTPAIVTHFNNQLKALHLNPDLQDLHKQIDISEISTATEEKASLITIGIVPRLDAESKSEGSEVITSKFHDWTSPSQVLHDIGIIARVVRVERLINGKYQVFLEGFNRMRVENYTSISQTLAEAQVSVFTDESERKNTSSTVDLSQSIWLKQHLDDLEALKSATLKLIKLMDSLLASSGITPEGSIVMKHDLLNRLVDVIKQTHSRKSASILTDILAAILSLDFPEKIALLRAIILTDRIKLTTEIVLQRISQFSNNINDSENNKQREEILRQKLNDIKKELEENSKTPNKSSGTIFRSPLQQQNDDEDDEIVELKKTLESAELNPEGRKIVQRELKRLKRMHPTQAEYQVCRTYLETLAEIPWNKYTDDNVEENPVLRARQILDEDHYSLEKVKKRLLEYLAVLHLKQKRHAAKNSMALVKLNEPAPRQVLAMDKSPILLLVGPPGVGKTSLAKSVARALGRKFHRISLGGVRDEAEIRGHRRTYVGAMPGVLVQGLRKVGAMNPVVLLDEIDKVSKSNFQGDPSAALLEVLDPEQNHTFTDHYVNFPVDLSTTLFIATANSLQDIPAPLLDRMETINLEGYTYMEKKHIAHNYLIPKQVINNGLKPSQVDISDETILKIISQYTREAGVRNLEREIGAICRGKAVELLGAETRGNLDDYISTVRVQDLEKYLGLESYKSDIVDDEVDEYADKTSGLIMCRHTYGVVNGLAYMGSGNGGLLTFEATTMPGSGKIKYTGHLGSVISESAEIALSFVRANAFKLGLTKSLDQDVVHHMNIHLHAPQGAIPKDGPSAGVAMTITLISLLAHRPVPRDIAMTGEMTLRGKILPVGGIREKLLGAHMSGIHCVLLPYHTRKVVEEECQFLNDLDDFQVIYVKYIWDVLAAIWPEEPHPVVLDGHL